MVLVRVVIRVVIGVVFGVVLRVIFGVVVLMLRARGYDRGRGGHRGCCWARGDDWHCGIRRCGGPRSSRSRGSSRTGSGRHGVRRSWGLGGGHCPSDAQMGDAVTVLQLSWWDTVGVCHRWREL